MIIKKILIILAIFMPFVAMSWTGSLSGKIIDAEIGEELIGATIVIKGTGTGASTDLDGNYTISNLAPGTYTFISQYISFQSQKFENVEIKEGEVTVLNVGLKSVSMGLEEVVITAKANNRTEAALLSIQKKSANVLEGLSAEQMKRSGDSDAATALKRITGINVVGGKYIFIRGLSDRYSKTTLNAAEIPGLDPNRNTVQMDIFPSSLIENIIVYKTFSPDLPADFTGGLVDIQTRDFPEKFQLDAGISFGYNTQASFNSNFLTYQGSSTDILGFDNGFRKIPNSAYYNIPDYTAKAKHQELTNISTDFNKIMAPSMNNSFLNSKFSISVGDQKRIGKESQLGYVFGFSYKYVNEYYENGTKGRYKLGGAGESQLITEHKYNDIQGTSEALWGVLLNTSYKINANHKIGLNVFKNQSGMSAARYMIGKKPSDDADDLFIETRVLQWLERSLNTGQIRGEHYFENLSKFSVEWIGAVTYSYQDEPDMRFFTNSYYPSNNAQNTYQIQPAIYKVPARYYRFMEEMNYYFKGDFKLDLGSSNQLPKLKFGGSCYFKDRTFDDKRIDYDYKYPITDNSYNGNVDDFIADENMGTNYPNYDVASGANFGLFVRGNPGDDLKNSYTANQTVTAAYAMIDTKLWGKLRFVGGLRYEHTLINSQSNDISMETGYLNNNDFLPSLNFTYEVKKNMNIRYNISRTLARPTFRELAPYANENFAGGETYVGNAKLQRTLINNIDLKWEYFMRSGEIVSLGAFYKGFTKPIELVDNPRAQNPELKWENVDGANVYGIEADFRKKLDFVNALRNLRLGINVSYIYSSVAIDSVELEAIKATDPIAKDNRPMSGQSPYIVNVFLGYENNVINFSANLVYNVTGPKIVINVKGGTPDIYEQPLHSLNFIANKSIGENFILRFKATNILNSIYKQTYTYNSKEYDYRSFKRGSLFEIGVEYQIR